MDYIEFQSKIGILRSFHYPHYTLSSTKQIKMLNLKGLNFKDRILIKYLHGKIDKKRIKFLIKRLDF